MNEQNKKQIIMAAILGVILVAVLVKQFVLTGAPASPAGTAAKTAATSTRTAAGGQPAARPGGGTSLQKAEVDLDALIASVEVEPMDYAKVRISRNPMAPLVGMVTPLSGAAAGQQGDPDAPLGKSATSKVSLVDAYAMRVTGIVWDNRNPVAVLDNEIVSVGHVFPNGTQVYSIEPTRVVLKVGDSLIPIEMKEL